MRPVDRLGERLVQARQQQGAVGQAGQRVVVGLLAQPILQGEPRAGVLLAVQGQDRLGREALEQVDDVAVEVARSGVVQAQEADGPALAPGQRHRQGGALAPPRAAQGLGGLAQPGREVGQPRGAPGLDDPPPDRFGEQVPDPGLVRVAGHRGDLVAVGAGAQAQPAAGRTGEPGCGIGDLLEGGGDALRGADGQGDVVQRPQLRPVELEPLVELGVPQRHGRHGRGLVDQIQLVVVQAGPVRGPLEQDQAGDGPVDGPVDGQGMDAEVPRAGSPVLQQARGLGGRVRAALQDGPEQGGG